MREEFNFYIENEVERKVILQNEGVRVNVDANTIFMWRGECHYWLKAREVWEILR